MPKHILQQNIDNAVSHKAVIVAAGKGLRFLAAQKKQFTKLNGEMIVHRALRAYTDMAAIDEIILVVPASDFSLCEEMLNNVVSSTPIQLVAGGDSRFESVYCGLSFIADEYDFPHMQEGSVLVSVHDGVRPFVTPQLIEQGLLLAAEHGAAVPVIAMKETVKQIGPDGLIEKTIPRQSLYKAQTPQTFDFFRLFAAYEKARQTGADYNVYTDEAYVWELFNQTPIQSYLGDENNIKITTLNDLSLAETFLKTSLLS